MDTRPKGRRDVGGMVCAALFILGAVAALYDTTTMVDADSIVFPRTVAIAMIVFSVALICWNLVRPAAAEEQPPPGSTPRRVALVVAMLACTGLMPVIGFAAAGLGTVVTIMLIAMYDPWTRFRVIVYPLVCVALVAGFYALFSEVLLVPLPTGMFF